MKYFILIREEDISIFVTLNSYNKYNFITILWAKKNKVNNTDEKMSWNISLNINKTNGSKTCCLDVMAHYLKLKEKKMKGKIIVII
jgi:hypothetical protein